MSEQIKQDIDLIEILFYLKKKIRVILFIIAICMAMVLLFLYINKDNIKSELQPKNKPDNTEAYLLAVIAIITLPVRPQ